MVLAEMEACGLLTDEEAMDLPLFVKPPSLQIICLICDVIRVFVGFFFAIWYYGCAVPTITSMEMPLRLRVYPP